jgi:hypothetical protein
MEIDNMYRNNPHTVDELKEEISSVFIRITADTLNRAVANFQHLGCQWLTC